MAKHNNCIQREDIGYSLLFFACSLASAGLSFLSWKALQVIEGLFHQEIAGFGWLFFPGILMGCLVFAGVGGAAILIAMSIFCIVKGWEERKGWEL